MIYSWQYGVGIEKYIGKDFGYIKADIGRNKGNVIARR